MEWSIRLEVIAPAATLMALACGPVDRVAVKTVRDSAGVQIVENAGPVWAPGQGWRLAETPSVQIGGIDVAPEYALYNVRAALRLDGGRILVADDGSSSLRLYAADGAYLRSFGRKGEGPGEFKTIWTMARFGRDSLLVWDSGNLRFSVHGADGTFARTYTLSGGDDRTYFPGPHLLVLADRSVLGLAWLNVPMAPNGLFRPDATYYRFTPDGVRQDAVVKAPFGEFMIHHFEGTLRNMPGKPAAMTALLFSKSSQLVASGRSVWVGTEDRYTLDEHDSADGRLVRSVRYTAFQLEPVTAAYVEAEIDRRLAQVDSAIARMPSMATSGWKAAQLENLRSLPTPEFFPAYQDVRADRAGNLWVQDYALPDKEARRWTVFAADGQMLGSLTFPSHFEPYDIGDDYILGKYVDALELEYVRLYRLEKPPIAND